MNFILHALSDFIEDDCTFSDLCPSYYYEGRCPQSGELLRLLRTPMAEAIARSLMQYLANDDGFHREGKMYGIVFVELPTGEQRILKAFSGLLNGNSVVEGWVPPIPGREEVADEWLIVVNKPPGLLSVPGRYGDRLDSVESRLRHLLPNVCKLFRTAIIVRYSKHQTTPKRSPSFKHDKQSRQYFYQDCR